MSFDFDEIIDRRNTDSLKYDFAVVRGKPETILPLWVADMDFRTPAPIIEALVKKSRHGIFGYSDTGKEYMDTLQNWFSRRFGWQVEPEWLIKTPGVVFAISAAIRALTNIGDTVLIQQPVYYPFAGAVNMNERCLAVNQLIYSQGRYGIDFEDFEKQIIEKKVKLFILCSPHNPVGRVWKEEELLRLGEICLKHNVIVISDEIHADFVYSGYHHCVFASLRPEFRQITITCTAPTKTFNLAGLQISNIWIANPELRTAMEQEMWKNGYSQLNTMGIIACKAAYSQGEEWLEALKEYLTGNLQFVREFLRTRLPQIQLVEPEGTYLIWLDFQALNLTDAQLDELIVHKAGLWLDEGTIFGKGGSGFQRINMACPRSTLERALIQLERAIQERA